MYLGVFPSQDMAIPHLSGTATASQPCLHIAHSLDVPYVTEESHGWASRAARALSFAAHALYWCERASGRSIPTSGIAGSRVCALHILVTVAELPSKGGCAIFLARSLRVV